MDLLAIDEDSGAIFSLRSGFAGAGGLVYCNRKSLNSSGRTAVAAVHRLPFRPESHFSLRAFDLPLHAPVLFLAAQSTGFVPGAGGSLGTLCLGQSIGRFDAPGQIVSSGPDGVVSFEFDSCAFPTPSGLVCHDSGQGWHFQAWYRDPANGSSNFSAAVSFE